MISKAENRGGFLTMLIPCAPCVSRAQSVTVPFRSRGAESGEIGPGWFDPESVAHPPGRGSAGVPAGVSLMGRFFYARCKRYGKTGKPAASGRQSVLLRGPWWSAGACKMGPRWPMEEGSVATPVARGYITNRFFGNPVV